MRSPVSLLRHFRRFQKDGDWRKAHSTPLTVSIDGNPVMCSTGANAAYGYDPRTGKELWRVEHEAYSASPRPVFSDGNFIIVTGFSKGASMMSVKAGGEGVVTDTHVIPFPTTASTPPETPSE